MDVGTSGVSALPDRFVSKQGFLALERDFPARDRSGRDRRLERVCRRRRRRRSNASAPASRPTPASARRSSTRSADGDAAAPHRPRPGRPVGDAGGRGRARAPRGDRPGSVRGDRCRGARRRHDLGEHRLLRLGHRPCAVGDRARAAPHVHAPDRRLPLRGRRGHCRRAQPALGRRRLRAARARLPGRRRRRPARLPDDGHDRGVGAAVPLLGALRALDGLPGVPAQPDPGALRPDPATRPTRSPSVSGRPRESSRARH